MRRSRRRYVWILPIALALTIGLVSGAVAYWVGAGSGAATTVLADTQPLTFAPGVATAQLYPGGATGVATVASNPNSFFVHIGSITIDAGDPEAIQVDAAHSGCNLSSLHFLTQDNQGAGWQVPPRAGTTDGTLTIDLPGALTMSSDAANACQGAIFTGRVAVLP